MVDVGVTGLNAVLPVVNEGIDCTRVLAVLQVEVEDVVVMVEVTLVLRSAITVSDGTANSTVQAAAFKMNGVISCHVPFLSMNGATSEFGMLHE